MTQRRGQKVVPLDVAQKLLAERDELRAKLGTQAEAFDRLQDRLTALEQERVELERQLVNARAELTEQQRFREEAQPPSSDVDEEAYQRRIAQLANDLERVRKRSKDEVDRARVQERRRLLAGLGDVLDSVERALKADEIGSDHSWRDGLVAIRQQLLAFLRSHGAEITGEVGEALDPRIHEALAAIDANAQAGTVVQVERHGIVLDDGSVARTAQVVVAR